MALLQDSKYSYISVFLQILSSSEATTLMMTAEESKATMPSPLTRVAKRINVANCIFGFPYRVRDGRLVLSRMSPWIALAVMSAANISMGFMINVSVNQVMRSANISFVDYLDYTGYSKLDVIVFNMINIIGLAVIIVMACSAPRVAEKLDGAFHQLASLGIDGLGYQTYERMRRLHDKFIRTAVVVLLLPLFIAWSFIFSYNYLFKHTGYGNVTAWAIFVLGSVLPFVGFLNPLAFNYTSIAVYLFGCMIEGYTFLKDLVECDIQDMETFRNRQSASRTAWKRILQMGQRLNLLQVDLNSTLSTDLLVLCGSFLLYLTIFSYNCLSALLKVDMSSVFIAINTVIAALLGLIFFTVFYVLCLAGQWLEDKREEAREALEDRLVEEARDLDEETREQLEVVISKMEEPKPISPCSAFAVNHAGFLNTMTTSFTYLIVLLQFKTAERVK